uniref:Uncharacterized protein n=1 Tax=Rhodosorus marinus TaxID=101924 RepID=A0A7S2ZQP9_9RHOD|mmetsp:Transcript_28823/g.112312  ORF Transcript_28823/g.112312 Transcript_28823/m.112312 type:complete len:226 (+) Transcript_28823:140-817(+)
MEAFVCGSGLVRSKNRVDRRGVSDLRMSASRREFMFSIAGVAIVNGLPKEASANVNLMAAKRSYFRYVPRIEEGINYYMLALSPAVNAGDWGKVSQAFVKTSVAREGSEKALNDIDPKTTILEREFFVPMRTWSNSFAEKGTSPKSRAMLVKVDAFEKEMDKLKKATKNQNQADASASWELGRTVLNEYIDIANKGLSRELRKLENLPEDAKSFQKIAKRPDTTF